MHIGIRIRNQRKKMGYTQEELAFKANISQTAISRYELGVNEPTADAIAMLAKTLDCTADYLLGLVDQPARPISNDLDEAEIELLMLYRGKSPEAKQKMRDIAKVI